MSIRSILRKSYFKTTDLTHGIQGQPEKISSFYKFWAFCYDFTVNLDPAYSRGLKKMIDSVVRKKDFVFDVGCGTGLSTIYASRIADTVIGIDMSQSMSSKLKKKITTKKIENIKIIHGSFPEKIPSDIKFDSVISSFMLVHFEKNQLKSIYKDIFGCLKKGGKIGLFLAQGEFASSFETKEEIIENLKSANFQDIEVEDIFDVYRIVKAEKSPI